MKQSSIFEFQSRQKIKRFDEVIDLTSDNEDHEGNCNQVNPKLIPSITTESHIITLSTTSEYVSGILNGEDNPFIEPKSNLVKQEVLFEDIGNLATPHPSLITLVFSINENKIDGPFIKHEHYNDDDIMVSGISNDVDMMNVDEEDQRQELPADSTLLRFYDSDSDLNSSDEEDADYDYRSLNDIDLNYDSDDEDDYCFKIIGDPPKREKQQNKINIDNIKQLELVNFQDDCCPLCRVYLGELTDQFRQAHIQGCLIKANFTISPVKLAKERPPSLVKLPLYRNDLAIPSPTKKIDPPKNISFKSKRKPIPELKILEFPVNPFKTYKISMDAFNYCPHEEINMYFLSHFHQDHYGGISKKWTYERVFDCLEDFDDLSKYKAIIYCSEVTAKLLRIKFGIDPRFVQVLEFETKYLIKLYVDFHDHLNCDEKIEKVEEVKVPGLYVTLISANHCPGSAIFLYESFGDETENKTYLHCGDFRVNKNMLQHKLLKPYLLPNPTTKLDKVYLDTTYLTFHYNFPKQEEVCDQVSQMFRDLCCTEDNSLLSTWFGINKQSRITDFLKSKARPKKKFLIVVGTYVIGKERLAISILKQLNNCPIFILSIKSRGYQYDVVKAFGDNYLNQTLTENEFGDDESDCIIHLVPMDIIYTMEEFKKYIKFNKYLDHFERCVALRPTGWSYTQQYLSNKELDVLEYSRPNNISRNQFLNKLCDICLESPPFTYLNDILPQNKPFLSAGRRDRDTLRIYSLPYSEHSSYRELSYFCLFLNIGKIIPTVGTEEERIVTRMNQHISYWQQAKNLKKSKVKDPSLDSMIFEKLKDLTLDKF